MGESLETRNPKPELCNLNPNQGGAHSRSNWVVFYLGILRLLWYSLWSKILSSFWGIIFYVRNIILLGSTTKKSLLNWFQALQDGAFAPWIREGRSGPTFQGLGGWLRSLRCSGASWSLRIRGFSGCRAQDFFGVFESVEWVQGLEDFGIRVFPLTEKFLRHPKSRAGNCF